MSKNTYLIIFLICLALPASAQNVRWEKLSPLLCRAAMEARMNTSACEGRNIRMCKPNHLDVSPIVTALVKCAAPGVLTQEGCSILHSWGDIHACGIPQDRLPSLSLRPEVVRIEAGAPCSVCVDTTAVLLGTKDLWKGVGVPGGLTGRGIVVGIQDIGFDLTHPTFYDRNAEHYRIKAFWDMLDTDTLNSMLYVGRDYLSEEELLEKAHARDGLNQTHGTHTAGIAAGSGYDSPYIGMAPEAELCLVANAVSSDRDLIDEASLYKYTTATDILGFQYIFDYADRVGKPCVISFSEGSHEDLYGTCQLQYEVLERMTGQGRIIVASAGNSSVNKTYLEKPYGQENVSSFIYSNSKVAYYTIRHGQHTRIDLDFSTDANPALSHTTYSVNTGDIVKLPDNCLVDTLKFVNEEMLLLMATYPTCYNADEWATELYIETLTKPALGNAGGNRVRLSLNGREDRVECFASGGLFLDVNALPQYCNAVPTHNINFPAAAPAVIAVGASAYRTGMTNYEGTWKSYDMGDDGRVWAYSSVGPTMQGHVKPDVLAPGCNIVSAYSSFYIENHPKANDVSWDVSHFDFNGRTYAWNCNSGTSMSAPIVGGIIALWLQLCPTLTPQQVMETIQATSHRYDTKLDYPNNSYGSGEINALEGAKYIAAHFPAPDALEKVEQAGRVPESDGCTFDLSGKKVAPGMFAAKGVYLVSDQNGKFRKMVK